MADGEKTTTKDSSGRSSHHRSSHKSKRSRSSSRAPSSSSHKSSRHHSSPKDGPQSSVKESSKDDSTAPVTKTSSTDQATTISKSSGPPASASDSGLSSVTKKPKDGASGSSTSSGTKKTKDGGGKLRKHFIVDWVEGADVNQYGGRSLAHNSCNIRQWAELYRPGITALDHAEHGDIRRRYDCFKEKPKGKAKEHFFQALGAPLDPDGHKFIFHLENCPLAEYKYEAGCDEGAHSMDETPAEYSHRVALTKRLLKRTEAVEMERRRRRWVERSTNTSPPPEPTTSSNRPSASKDSPFGGDRHKAPARVVPDLKRLGGFPSSLQFPKMTLQQQIQALSDYSFSAREFLYELHADKEAFERHVDRQVRDLNKAQRKFRRALKTLQSDMAELNRRSSSVPRTPDGERGSSSSAESSGSRSYSSSSESSASGSSSESGDDDRSPRKRHRSEGPGSDQDIPQE